MRRLLDLLVSTAGLLVLSPVFVVVGLWIKRDSPGPVFYLARRVGRDGVLFNLYKFRTMVPDADKRGPGITVSNDQRITRSGRFLRRTKVDELPQLINVFKGEMSLVGPRPEDPRYVARYTPEQRVVLSVRPGITSPASLVYHDESALLSGRDWEHAYTTEIMPHKLALETAYLSRRTVWRDLGIIWQTIWLLVKRS